MVQPFDQGGVRGFLHIPDQLSGDGLVMTHGAGGNCTMPLVMAVADAFATLGVTVLRCDLAFRQKRPYGPPSLATAPLDRAGLREAIDAIREIVHGRVFLGGQSYGGRQASMLAAEDAGVADGLLLLSYPLHPPGKPSQLRTAHFGQLNTPAFFVQGSKDPLGSLEKLRAAMALIPARTELVEVAGAGHDLAKGKFDLAGLVQRYLKQP